MSRKTTGLVCCGIIILGILGSIALLFLQGNAIVVPFILSLLAAALVSGNRAFIAFTTTVVLYMFTSAYDEPFSTTMSIACMGAFIISAIENKK